VRFVLSALQTFSADFADHARHGACDACASPGELPLPMHSRGGADRRQGIGSAS